MAPLLIAGLAALASAGINQYSQNKVLKKQQKQVRAGMRDTAASRAKATALLDNRVADLTGGTGETQQENSLGEYMRALSQAQGVNRTVQGSDAYDTLADDALGDVNTYGAGTGATFAALDAPFLQRQAEGNATADLGIGLDRIGDELAAKQYERQMRIARIRPNPWLSIASSALSGVSGAAAQGGFGLGGAGAEAPGAMASTPWPMAEQPAQAAGYDWSLGALRPNRDPWTPYGAFR